MMALVDTGSKISALAEGFCTEMALRILPMRNLMGVCCVLRRWGGISILYTGYIEVNFTIPDLP